MMGKTRFVSDAEKRGKTMSKNHYLGGKTKPAGIKPPEVKNFLHWYACGRCDAVYVVSMHEGSNQVAIDCSCGALTHGIVRVSETGRTISHNLSMEYAEKLE
jgi:hypothetical protein